MMCVIKNQPWKSCGLDKTVQSQNFKTKNTHLKDSYKKLGHPSDITPECVGTSSDENSSLSNQSWDRDPSCQTD